MCIRDEKEVKKNILTVIYLRKTAHQLKWKYLIFIKYFCIIWFILSYILTKIISLLRLCPVNIFMEWIVPLMIHLFYFMDFMNMSCYLIKGNFHTQSWKIRCGYSVISKGSIVIVIALIRTNRINKYKI